MGNNGTCLRFLRKFRSEISILAPSCQGHSFTSNNQYNFVYRQEAAGQSYNKQLTNKSIENVAS